MKLFLVVTIVLLLGGCINPPIFLDKVSSYNEPYKRIPPPPSIEDYRLLSDERAVINLYTTDMNWYLFYLFSYTKILNQYAMERGWSPPNTEPLCKVFAWPRSLDIPNFSYKEGMTPEELDVELTIFITNAKKAYEGQVRLFDEAENWQRRLCIY